MKRQDALKLGLHRYISDAPCKHGHEPVRYASTGGCVKCNSQNVARNRTKSMQIIATARSGMTRIDRIVHPSSFDSINAMIDAINVFTGVPNLPTVAETISARNDPNRPPYS